MTILQEKLTKTTLKTSYSCMPHLERKISTHNKFILERKHNKHLKDHATVGIKTIVP